MEKIKSGNEKAEIVLTFFSPSGYEVRSGYPLATVMYLPADLPGHATAWVDALKPDLAVFVKYDLWPGYLKALDKQKIPAILISAHWQPENRFASYHLSPSRALLRRFRKIFLQSSEHLEHYASRGFSNLDVAGDTRIDRCLNLPGEAQERIPSMLRERQPYDLVAGSTWPRDEQLLIKAMDRLHLKVIIAPHDVSGDNIRRLMQTLPVASVRLSELGEITTSASRADVIIIDSIGLLNALYDLGHIAYVGGGFGSGIHNILEPMAHGKPLIFGPNYGKFPEATAMVEAGGAISIGNAEELCRAIEHFSIPETATLAGKIATDYLNEHAGASGKVTKYILESIP